jgi:hypothetical protein
MPSFNALTTAYSCLEGFELANADSFTSCLKRFRECGGLAWMLRGLVFGSKL